MGIKSFYYKVTVNKEKYNQQIAADNAESFAELQTRLGNVTQGREANRHHGWFRRGLSSLVDSNIGFKSSHGAYVVGTGLGITVLAGVTAPPVGIALLSVSGFGFLADRLSGNHDARKGMRDLERYFAVLRDAERQIAVKHNNLYGQDTAPLLEIERDPVIVRIRELRTKLSDEYINRFCAKEAVPISEFYRYMGQGRAEQGLDTADSSKGGVAAKAAVTVTKHSPKVAKASLMAVHLKNASMIAGKVSLLSSAVIGGATRAYQLVGRSAWDVRIINAGLASEVLACVTQAKKAHGVDMSRQKQQLEKISGQALRPQKYINAWKNTGAALSSTIAHKTNLQELLKQVTVAPDKENLNRLQQALKQFSCDAGYYKDPLILGTDRFKFWQKNPLKTLANDIEKFAKISLDPKNLKKSLENITGSLKKLDEGIVQANERNDTLVGKVYAANNRHLMASVKVQPTVQQKPEPKKNGLVGEVLTNSTAKIAGSGALATGASIMAMSSDFFADAMDVVVNVAQDPSVAAVAGAAGLTILTFAVRSLSRKDKNEIDSIRGSLADDGASLLSPAPGKYTQAEINRRSAANNGPARGG